MHLYKRISETLQCKIDNIMNKINIKYTKNYVLEELIFFHKKRLIKLYISYYKNWLNKYPKLCLNSDLILNNLLFWLNHPYSQQMDTPFMTGNISDRCRKILKILNPNKNINEPFSDNGIFLNNEILKYFFKGYKKNIKYYNVKSVKYNNIQNYNNFVNHSAIMNILNNLTYIELEDLYTYTKKAINNIDDTNICKTTLKFK